MAKGTKELRQRIRGVTNIQQITRAMEMVASTKLLIEAGYTPFRYNPIFGHPPPDGITNLIPVTEQSNAINPATGQRYAPQPTYAYRAVESWGWAVGKTDGWRASASYVTGAHNMKLSLIHI